MRKRVISFLLALLCAIMTFSLSVTATETETDERCSLTLHYYIEEQGRAMSNVNFYLYKVGEYLRSPNKGIYDYELTEDFVDANCQVDLTGLNFRTDGERLGQLINTLIPYTQHIEESEETEEIEARVKPMQTVSTDAGGNLTFKGLGLGLYLVWGDISEIEESDGKGGVRELRFTPQPLLIPLPYPIQDGSFEDEMRVDVKYEQLPPSGAASPVPITVEKKWEPAGRSHPDSVTVALYRADDPIDEDPVELNDGNNWTHTWPDKDPTFVWLVKEIDIPDGYTVSIDKDGFHFTVTNTITDPPPSKDDPTPDDPDDPADPMPSDDPTDPDVLPILSNISNDKDSRKLPQTGQLWWPVPLLLAAGVPLLLIGAVLFVRKEEPEKIEEPYE